MFADQRKPPSSPELLYLELLKKCLTRIAFDDPIYIPMEKRLPGWARWLYLPFAKIFASKNYQLMKIIDFDFQTRFIGRDHPIVAETMIGILRLNNIQDCALDVIHNNIPGDFIETGVWRGGATIFMRGILKAFNIKSRKIWVADSFQGLPPPNSTQYPEDNGSLWHLDPELAVSVEIVKSNFQRYDLLDNQVEFLVGWFRDTLPAAPISEIAILRIDGDLYESTMDALSNLYPKVSIGGYVIVDDYKDIASCRSAIDDYRREKGITDKIVEVDWTCIYWKKTRYSIYGFV